MIEDIRMNKDLFNFKLGTTSFIYPDDIIPNVKKLGSAFDEIELLIFESIPSDVLPSKQDIRELVHLAQEFDLTYNIHLPVDVSLTDISKSKRDQAVEIIKRVVDLVSPLEPTTHTLHLESQGLDEDRDWYKRGFDAMGELVLSLKNPEIISIETLAYPFELIEPIIDEYGLSVCIDAGHLIKYGYSVKPVFEKYYDKIPLIHLHGVDFSKTPPQDHVSLDKTPEDKLADTLEVLKKFQGVVSLEVFNKENLILSLACLETLFS
ncbi:MAG: sugar phosphate isomerase/epimerase [Desulfobacteraceae bacterium]|nr:sugar phosphate isomerase/epimerase [Desulfobacteraceae bacterium]